MDTSREWRRCRASRLGRDGDQAGPKELGPSSSPQGNEAQRSVSLRLGDLETHLA